MALLLYLWWKLFIQEIINKKEQTRKKVDQESEKVQSKAVRGGRSKYRSPSYSNKKERALSANNRDRSKSPRSSSRNQRRDFSDSDDNY